MAGGVNTSADRRGKIATRADVPNFRDVAFGAQLSNPSNPATPLPELAPGQRSIDTSASVARNAAVAQKGIAAIPMVAGSTMADIAHAAPKALSVLGKMAVPLTAVAAGGEAIYQGIKGYQKDGVVGAVEGAAWGAADSISLGLFNWAMGRNADGTKSAPSGPAGNTEPPRVMTAVQKKDFARANQTYERRQAASKDEGEQGNGNHNRGTRNETNLRAIIAGRQARAEGAS